jgi:hypothetical protein
MGEPPQSVKSLYFPQDRLGHQVALGFVALFLGTGLAAYSLGPVPVPWLTQVGFVALAGLLIMARNRVRIVPGGLALVMFMAWTLLVSLVSAYSAEYFAGAMPQGATLPYGLFILARYINLLAFAAAFYLTFWLLTQGYAKFLVKWIVLIGIFVSLAAVYVYLAHSYGLPELPRTRLGTGGGEQATTFSSGLLFYRRALGTFREPNHLAEWLLLPLFLSLALSHGAARVSTLLIGSTLLLTVSLAGTLSAVMGGIAGTLMNGPFCAKNLKRTIGVVAMPIVLAVGLIGLSVGVVGEGQSIYSILSFRAVEILEGGVEASNRNYISEFIADNPFPLVGYGLGNANIVASEAMGNDLVVSYLSLYLNIIYSTGVVGICLLLTFLLPPLVRKPAKKGTGEYGLSPVFLMAYLAYLVEFGVSSEELSVPFAVAAAFLRYQGTLGSGLPSLKHMGPGRSEYAAVKCT